MLALPAAASCAAVSSNSEACEASCSARREVKLACTAWCAHEAAAKVRTLSALAVDWWHMLLLQQMLYICHHDTL